MMDELRELAKAPAAIFNRFLGELQRITGDKTLATPRGLDRLQDLQAARMREIHESLQRFRAKVGEAQARLAEALRPPPSHLFEKIERTHQELFHLIDLAAQREGLLRAWEEQEAGAIVTAYCAALDAQDLETAEIYETEAERFLRRKGDAAALQSFLDLRALAEARGVTPAQRQAQADLEEIERLKGEVTFSTRVAASVLRVSGDIAPLVAGWRKGGRFRLDPAEQASLRVLILPGPHPGMTARVLDVSYGGMQLGAPREAPARRPARLHRAPRGRPGRRAAGARRGALVPRGLPQPPPPPGRGAPGS